MYTEENQRDDKPKSDFDLVWMYRFMLKLNNIRNFKNINLNSWHYKDIILSTKIMVMILFLEAVLLLEGG